MLEIDINVKQYFSMILVIRLFLTKLYHVLYWQIPTVNPLCNPEPGNFTIPACIASTMRNVVSHVSAPLTQKSMHLPKVRRAVNRDISTRYIEYSSFSAIAPRVHVGAKIGLARIYECRREKAVKNGMKVAVPPHRYFKLVYLHRLEFSGMNETQKDII